MVAIKSHQAEAFLKKPSQQYAVVLFYGTDPGLVSERALRAARAWAELDGPDGEIIRIDDQDLEQTPDRLTVELDTVPMFGGRKVVRVGMGRKINSAMLKPVVQRDDLQCVLIIEAGNLKPSDGMRKACEAAEYGAAVACYPDESKDLGAVADEVLGEAGLTIAPEVRDVLVARLGANRALSRGELEKLALYCRGKERVLVEDVDAIVGDAAEIAVDRIIMAAASGNAGDAAREFDRYIASGESPQTVVIFLQRHFDRLHRVRCDLDAGRGMADALRALRPPLHFKMRDAFGAQCRAWRQDRLGRALAAIGACTKAMRSTGAMQEILLERLLIALAQLGRQSVAR